MIKLLGISQSTIIFIVLGIVFTLILLYAIVMVTRIKKCPPDKIMVVYGMLGNRKDKDGEPVYAVCVHGGSKFIWPLVQSYAYLDLTPIPMSLDITAKTADNERINMTVNITAAISTEAGIMENAAERLLTMPREEIKTLCEDIMYGQLRLLISENTLEWIERTDGRFFWEKVSANIENEIKQIGLRLVNIRLLDIKQAV